MMWERDEYLAEAAALLPSLQVLSLDVFDTLLFRTCERPEDVFDEVARRAAVRGCLHPALRPGEYGMLRKAAQDRAYATLGREPTLEDIHAGLPAHVGDRGALLALELEVEAETCVLNPSVDSLVKECEARGIAVVLLSDMYLGKQRVRTLLGNAGFDVDRRVRHLLVSVDEGAYKMTGALFARLQALCPGVPPTSMLHVGDNLQSDVRMARAAGMRAIHYDVVRRDPDGTFAAETLVHREVMPALGFPRRLAGTLAAGVSADDRPWFRVGAQVAGPFAAALVHWAIDQCLADGVTLVAPLMREAHVLGLMLERTIAARTQSLSVAPLHVSRHAVALASITDPTREVPGVVLAPRFGLSVAEAVGMVGLELPPHLREHAGTLVTEAHEVALASGNSLHNALATWLTSAESAPHVEDAVTRARDLLGAYLAEAIAGHEVVATLDLGFYGSIQRGLSTTAAQRGLPVRFVHLLGIAHGPVVERILDGMDVRAFAASYGSHADLARVIHRAAPVIEQLFQGSEGSTVGYARDTSGRVAPVLEDNPLPAPDLAAKAIVRDGMSAFHELWLGLAAARPATARRCAEAASDWCHLLHRLVDAPTAVETATLGTLHDDVNDGSRTLLPFCPEALSHQVALRGTGPRTQAELAALPAAWPQGVVSRAAPGSRVASRAAMAPLAAHAPLGFVLAGALQRRGFTRVIGYGTGEVAQAFIDAARIVGVPVLALVDNDPGLEGCQVRGIPVYGLDQARALAPQVIVVLSVAHAPLIADRIRRAYGRAPHMPLILDPTAVTTG